MIRESSNSNVMIPRGTTQAHVDDDHAVCLLGTASRLGIATSSRPLPDGSPLVVRHTGGPIGSGPFGVGDCESGLEAHHALGLIELLQAVR